MSSQPSGSLGGVQEEPILAAEPRLCDSCEEPISEKRLAVVPHARMCTVCTEAAGDVPKIKRFDETIGRSEEAEVISTYYMQGKTNQYLQLMIERDMNTALSQLVPGEFTED